MATNLATQLREGTSKSHSMAEKVSFVKSFLGGNNVFLDIYKIDPSVQAKLDELSDMYSDGKLSVGTELNLIVDKDTVKAV